jgi:hypothetical protein
MSLNDNRIIAADDPAPATGAKVPLGAKLKSGPLTPFFEKIAVECPTIVSKAGMRLDVSNPTSAHF